MSRIPILAAASAVVASALVFAGPAVGKVIIDAFGWRQLFVAFIVFGAVACTWLGTRQPETLAPENRRPLSFRSLWDALLEVCSHRVILVSTLVQTLILASLFGSISSIQQIFADTFGVTDTFPMWFACIALIAATANFVNARLVVRLGMRYLITMALGAQVIVSAVFATMSALGLWPEALYFWAYFIWATTVFFMTGLTMGNLNAMALEPVGHIAGMAASLVSALSTVFAVVLAVPLGLSFDGTPVPLMVGVTVLSGIGFLAMQLVRRQPR